MPFVNSGLDHATAVRGAPDHVSEGLVVPKSSVNITSSVNSKFEREARCQKRDLIARIDKLGIELSLCNDKQEVTLCWDKLENLGKDVTKFYHLLTYNVAADLSAEMGDKVRPAFENLQLEYKDKISQMAEQPDTKVLSQDSVSNVSTALFESSSRALFQVDLELQREELQIDAKYQATQDKIRLQAEQRRREIELRDAKLRAEQRRQKVLSSRSSREGSLVSRKSRVYSGMGPHVGVTRECSKSASNQVAACKTEEVDVTLGVACDTRNTVEALHVGNTGENAISIPWAYREIAHSTVYVSAAQTRKCLLSFAATNPFTQKLSSVVERDDLSASEPGKDRGGAPSESTTRF